MFNAPEVAIIGFDYLNATELEEMQRNLDLLYSTRAGTCPGDRNFGLEQTFESCPTNVAQNLFALEVIEKTEIYENKAEVLSTRRSPGRKYSFQNRTRTALLCFLALK